MFANKDWRYESERYAPRTYYAGDEVVGISLPGYFFLYTIHGTRTNHGSPKYYTQRYILIMTVKS
jgi:hypothetical protein